MHANTHTHFPVCLSQLKEAQHPTLEIPLYPMLASNFLKNTELTWCEPNLTTGGPLGCSLHIVQEFSASAEKRWNQRWNRTGSENMHTGRKTIRSSWITNKKRRGVGGRQCVSICICATREDVVWGCVRRKGVKLKTCLKWHPIHYFVHALV
jgi:hypothetical protein